MRNSLLLGSAALVLALAVGGPAAAQMSANIDFGDDSSAWANDGQCDDPRFEGPGAATFSVSADRMRDGTDCREAFAAGTVTLVTESETPPATPPETPETPPLTPPEVAPPVDDQPGLGAIDYGDDSGAFPNDGECDDPRFEGSGVWSGANDEGILSDATDCRAAVEAGTATLAAAAPADIDYGDDTGLYPNDGECDDPRFVGEGVWADASQEGVRTDATDCRAAVEAGTATFDGEFVPAEPVDPVGMVEDIDFGDNSSDWANDGECDDGRFAGEGMGLTNFNHVMMDANDCLAAFQAGTVTFVGDGTDDTGYVGFVDDIDFGDNMSEWARDGECDDGRFEGEGMGLIDMTNAYMDADDCLAAYQAGTITFVGDAGADAGPATDTGSGPIVNFGDDTGTATMDGICDDPRFQGSGAASLLYPENRMADATDCRAAYESGAVTLAP